jgi:hypothetical protein
MSTVAEIWSAIQEFSAEQRCELETLLHSDGDSSLLQNETPPNVQEKLAEAARGQFSPGDRSNVSKILASLK